MRTSAKAHERYLVKTPFYELARYPLYGPCFRLYAAIERIVVLFCSWRVARGGSAEKPTGFYGVEKKGFFEVGDINAVDGGCVGLESAEEGRSI